ncbi:kinase-like protein, partial [Auriscalpium vulgare]
SRRSFTPLKVLVESPQGTAWLCHWHGHLQKPLPRRQSRISMSEGVRKTLVTVRYIKQLEPGVDFSAKRLDQLLKPLGMLPAHQNVLVIYDAFCRTLLSDTYLVFEPVEGNLAQLIRTRRGIPFSSGLVASIFIQTIRGLHHIHEHVSVHGDLQPANVMITTTGLHEDSSLSSETVSTPSKERDLTVTVKLSWPPSLGTDLDSTPSLGYYRAPEVLLAVSRPSQSSDMWAFGAIMMEVATLRPLFKSKSAFGYIGGITTARGYLRGMIEVLGDPDGGHGEDARGRPLGGGRAMWNQADLDISEPTSPQDLRTLVPPHIPNELVACISDVLKYDPATRFTVSECLHHQY